MLRKNEAQQFIGNLQAKLQLLIDEGLAKDWVIKLWSTGEDTIQFGIEQAPKGPRKK